MPESSPHLLHRGDGVRMWVAAELDQAESWTEWMRRGEQMLAERALQADTVLGHGRGQTRRVVLGEGVQGVWRVNRHGGVLGGVQGDRYRTSARLAAEVLLSEELRARGIATPKVLFALAMKRGLSWRQHLVTEEIVGATTVFEAREETAALAAADELLSRLCDVGLWATDLHPANMLWQAAPSGADSEGRCWVIDLAGAKLLPGPLSADQRSARRQRFARYFAKHAGQIPAPFCG
ncbi:MAG: hypothetical protein HQ519_00325 [Planctomycetes bacterium]|nr:hypothetical protein [Planctomycetota bacterium]